MWITSWEGFLALQYTIMLYMLSTLLKRLPVKTLSMVIDSQCKKISSNEH